MIKPGLNCGKDGCDKKHHSMLHGKIHKNLFAEDYINFQESDESFFISDVFSSYDDFSTINEEQHAINSMTCYLLTPDGKIPVDVIIDSGSNTSNVDESLIKELKLKPSTPEFLRTVKYVSKSVSYMTAGYDLQLQSVDGSQTQLVRAYKVQNFSLRTPNWKQICESYDY